MDKLEIAPDILCVGYLTPNLQNNVFNTLNIPIRVIVPQRAGFAYNFCVLG